MNTNKKIIQVGIGLFLITMSIFFLLFYLFSTNAGISEAQYFNYSALISCFLLPAVYAGLGFYSSYSTAKTRILHFGEVWKLTFLPMFIGGFSSLALIFLFFNKAGAWAEDALQRGWYDLMTENPNPEFMEKNGELVEKMTDASINIFSLKIFFISFSVVVFYYFFISTIFAVFLRNRRV
ncbi:MAG: DUF4199 family protein [Weeksellaceae bacterium]|jgi:hypothetical protein|nr:DUF4199 family protein [Weeksellaceae bacterium]MDX9705352.1 DUF4199 family protein [Weeksellaceae bacterium]